MAKIDIRFGGYQGEFSVHNRAAALFGDTLAQTLGDDLAFELTPNVTEQGHNAVDLLDMVTSGEMTFCYFASSYLADRVPEFALLDLPFAIRDRAQAYAMLDGPLCRFLADRIDEVTGFRVVSWWDNAFRHLSQRKSIKCCIASSLHAPTCSSLLRLSPAPKMQRWLIRVQEPSVCVASTSVA